MGKPTRRDHIILIYEEERNEERCNLISQLKKEGVNLTRVQDEEIASINHHIDETEKTREVLRKQINELENQEKELIKTKKAILNQHRFLNFSANTCPSEELHPKLRNFDKETREYIKSILTDPLPK